LNRSATKSTACSKTSTAACGARDSVGRCSTCSLSGRAVDLGCRARRRYRRDRQGLRDHGRVAGHGREEHRSEVRRRRCEKKDEKEEKKKDYYLSERSYGSFQRSFQVPDGVDTDKIEATFKKGVLSVALPKSVEAQKAAKKIDVKAA
jgi:hypothetical protein